MSTPPVPPANENDGQKQQPQHGQNQPQYGQNAPQYGQNQPQYGQNAPQYGQNQPQYGQNAPQYGQNQPQYGQNAPQYGQNQPQYGQNPQQQFGQSQQQPYGQSPYGQSPYAQYPSEQPSAGSSKTVPQLVNISFYLIIVSAVVAVLNLLLIIPMLDDPQMRGQFEDQLAASGQTGISFEDIKGILVGTLVVLALIGTGLYALVAFNVRKGRNWARILGTVLAALSLLFLFPPSLFTLAGLAGIAAIVLLYLPGAAPYFRKQQPFANPYSQPYGR